MIDLRFVDVDLQPLHFDLEWSWRNLREDVGEEQKWQHFVVGEVPSPK